MHMQITIYKYINSWQYYKLVGYGTVATVFHNRICAE